MEIARIKQRDEHLSHIGLEQLCRTVMGQADSMGIKVTFEKEAALDINGIASAEQTEKTIVSKKLSATQKAEKPIVNKKK